MNSMFDDPFAPQPRSAIKPRSADKPRSANAPRAARRSPSARFQPHARDSAPAPTSEAEPGRSLLMRLGVLLAAIAVPVMAAPGDFGAIAADAAPEYGIADTSDAGGAGAMPFERAGMSFPGSAFYYLADPPMEALVALPSADPLADGRSAGGRDIGALIDAGPAARPFLAPGLGSDQARAQRCLAQAIWYEAGSESEAGQRAVAQVVLNRVAHPAWPGSVCGVVYQGSERRTGCQFTFTCDGSLARPARGASWEGAERIARAALSGEVYAPIGHATHYHTLFVNPYWAKTLDHIGTIGAHHFYRNRGRGGEKAAFSVRYAGAEPLVSGRIDRASAPRGLAAGSAEADVRAAALLPAPAGASPRPVVAFDTAATNPAMPDPARTGTALADPALAGAGRARAQYANAGRWKRDPAQAGKSTHSSGQADRAPESGETSAEHAGPAADKSDPAG